MYSNTIFFFFIIFISTIYCFNTFFKIKKKNSLQDSMALLWNGLILCLSNLYLKYFKKRVYN